MFLLRPPDLLRCAPLFEGKNACKTQENYVSARGVAIVNHCAIVNLLCIVNVLRRSLLVWQSPLGRMPEHLHLSGHLAAFIRTPLPATSANLGSYLLMTFNCLFSILVSHYSAIGDTISCDASYSAIGFRGKFFFFCDALDRSVAIPQETQRDRGIATPVS